MPIGEKEEKIVEKLAGSLDGRGYLEISVKKLAEYIPCSVRELRSALEILKSLEPTRSGPPIEGMSDSAVEATERLPACDYSGKKLSGRSVKT